MKGNWMGPVLKWKGALEKYKYVLLVMAVGVFLLMLPFGGGETVQETVAVQEETFDLEGFEEKLEQALSKIEGAGEAQVILSLDSGTRQVLAQDQEHEGDGGYRSATVTVGRGSGSQEVVPLQTMAPRFRGALVVCPGGGDPQVRLNLAQAVSSLTGLGADCITICQGNT